MKESLVLHPNQFEVNEAWIAFKLNEVPLRTKHDGDFDCIALMDAASCFMLGFIPVGASHVEPSQLESMQLLKQGQAHKKQWPKTLFIPKCQTAKFLISEAEKQGITVAHVPEDQLRIFIGEAREGFKERVGGGAPGAPSDRSRGLHPLT